MKIATNISERLKQLIGSKPVLLGSNDANVIGEIKMGLIEVEPGHWVDQCCAL